MTALTAFPPDTMARARKRMVREREDGDWYVEGDPRFGDAYPNYLVRLLPTHKYDCSCYHHANGDVRAHRICTHVKAVVLYRAKRRVIDRARARVAARHNNESQSQDRPAIPSPPSPAEARFGSTPFPAWVESFRAEQWAAIEEAVDCFERGNKVVFLDAPTGAGKSLIGETVRRLSGGSALYVATTKHLQDQLQRDFPYAAVLKGRANYTPTDGREHNAWGEAVQGPRRKGDVEVSCADCTKTPANQSCRWCPIIPACPYELAKMGALSAPLAVLNTSYFLTEANGPGRFSAKGKQGLVICDEADLLERELMSHVEVRLSPRRQKELGIQPPSKKTVEDSWVEWCREEAIPKVGQAVADYGPLDRLPDPRDIRAARSLRLLLSSLERLRDDLPTGGWVYDYHSGDRSDIAFKPIRVDRYGPDTLWKHGARFLLMSATIISAHQIAEDLGLEDDWDVVSVPMSFPVANRPIHVVPVVEMTKKTEDTARPIMADAVARVVAMHPGERVLVHTVSYALANFLANHLRKETRRPVLTYSEGRMKESTLQKYLATKGAVMVAPSMDRGVDLPDDACRVQIIAKIPYPNLGDKQVSARRHSQGGSSWYAVETVRTIVQMCGRGVRNKDDHAVTYILDHSWTTNLWHRHRSLFPQWFKDALNFRFPKHLITGPSATDSQ